MAVGTRELLNMVLPEKKQDRREHMLRPLFASYVPEWQLSAHQRPEGSRGTVSCRHVACFTNDVAKQQTSAGEG